MEIRDMGTDAQGRELNFITLRSKSGLSAVVSNYGAHLISLLVPGKDGEVLCRLGTTLDREKFEQMKTDYYELRGWDPVTGYPKREKLTELGLKDAADDLEARGLPV